MTKDMKAFVRELRTLGFDVEVKRHVSVSFHGRRVLTMGASPSDPRWEKHARHHVKVQTGIVV